ncbi:MAG TPA: hypothetical protein H9691_04910 [Firmicutes bacterium]|nr:hypothetical protein [Bacillota bacterium]
MGDRTSFLFSVEYLTNPSTPPERLTTVITAPVINTKNVVIAVLSSWKTVAMDWGPQRKSPVKQPTITDALRIPVNRAKNTFFQINTSTSVMKIGNKEKTP